MRRDTPADEEAPNLSVVSTEVPEGTVYRSGTRDRVCGRIQILPSGWVRVEEEHDEEDVRLLSPSTVVEVVPEA